MPLFHVFDTVINGNTGRPISGAQVRVKYDGTNTLAPIYANQSGDQFSPPNYCATDAEGMYSFYIDSGEYTLEYLVGGTIYRTIGDFRIGGTDGANKAEASAIGIIASAINMGTTPGSILSDNGTAKDWFEEIEATAAALEVGKINRDIGAPSGTPSTDLAMLNAAVASLPTRRVDLLGQTFTASAAITNQYGTPLKGGKVLIPSLISGYHTQSNSYAADVNGLMLGREHLAAWWKSVTAGTLQTVHLYGDSTVEQNALYVKSHEMFKLALYAAGVNNCLTANHGLGGTSWSDLNAIPNLGTSTKLIVIKYGINDATKADPLATMAADMRSKLAAIRAATNGDYTNLSILLMGPSSTYAPSHNQDAKWYEDVRNLYIQIAAEYRCAYFDTYAYLQDTSKAPGFWQDDLAAAPGYFAGEGLHPDPVAAYWIWFEGIKTHVLGAGQWNSQKANQHWNVAHATTQQFPTSEPQTFPFGISQWGVLTSDGWPANGTLIVHRQADGVTVQELITLDVVPRRLVRTGSGLVWTQWTVVQTAISAFLNSWVNVAGGYHPAGYMATMNGTVKLFGAIKSGTNGVSAFQLPSNVRPAYAHRFDVSGGYITVFGDGNVIPLVSATTHVTLDGIEFPVL